MEARLTRAAAMLAACLLAVVSVAAATSSEQARADVLRAHTPKPGPHFMGKDAAEVATNLNRHIAAHALGFQHKAVPCEEYGFGDLHDTLTDLYQATLSDADAQAFNQLYTERRDRRKLRFASLMDFKQSWRTELALLNSTRPTTSKSNKDAADEDMGRAPPPSWSPIASDGLPLGELAHAGRCYEAALIYIHHLSDKTKAARRFPRGIPLLPSARTAAKVEASLASSTAPNREGASQGDGAASSAARFVQQNVQDQVVCSRCHILPNTSFAPQQNAYITNLTHKALVQPEERKSKERTLHTRLRVTTSRLEGPLSFNVRSYERSTPGPTLRVRPGDTLRITLENTLDKHPVSCRATKAGGGADTNFYRCPNVTNLHLHGLWVEPHDVYSGVFPGQTRVVEYQIPADHAPGTNWYHPHFHGSVSLQLAMGMAGALIVEDDEASLPPALAAMKDVVMILQSVEYFNYTMDDIKCPHSANLSHCHNLDGAGSLSTLRTFSSDKMPLNMVVNDPLAGNPIPGNYFLVNGQYQPVVHLRPGEWQRWRTVNAAHQASVSLAVPGCTVYVLAMDGVYLRTPRHKNTTRPVVLPPGGRADLAVMCELRGQYHFLSRENPDEINLGQQEGFATGVLALLDVSGDHTSMQAPTSLPPLPAYLADTRHSTPASQHTVRWDVLRLINNTAGLTDVPIYGISGKAFNASLTPSTCVQVAGEHDAVRSGSTARPHAATGVTAEWTLSNPIWICNASQPLCLSTMNRSAASGPLLKKYEQPITISHGFHMHTFKFQVVDDSNGGDSFDYHVGDWRDTVTTPVAGWVRVRWRPQRFQGLVPFHCHMSPHSDRGMIATAIVARTCPANISEVSGTTTTAPAGAASEGVVAGSKDAAEPWSPQLTNYTMPITTTSRKAQHAFDEGMQLTFGFAHEAAARFFNECAAHDPECAMCYWGMAYASGPVINVPICGTPACGQGAEQAARAVELAKKQGDRLSAKERFLIDAMSRRYSGEPGANQTHFFRAYANALNDTKLVAEDPDVTALYAEAVMMLHAVVGGYRFYNTSTGLPFPEIAQVTRVLKAAFQLPTPGLRGKHPLVEHLYIHITEPSAPGFGPESAGRGLASAIDFQRRFNGTQWQHIQHMSGHVYLRVGRYGDVVTVNRIAHASDSAWLNHGLLPYGPGHNLAFLIYGACMDGQSQVARDFGVTLDNVYRAAPDRPDGPGPDLGWHIPMTTHVRFGNWSAVLATPEPFSMPRDWPYQRVLANYALGTAHAHVGNMTAARACLQALEHEMRTLTGRFHDYAIVARETLHAVLATAEHNHSKAIDHMQRAVDEQTSWPYDEPPDWHAPMRQCLGQALLAAGDYKRADAVFRADLHEYLHNGWSLFGLIQAMKQQPMRYTPKDIQAVKQELKDSWQRADVELTSSCPALVF